jgi:hypothetical protein
MDKLVFFLFAICLDMRHHSFLQLVWVCAFLTHSFYEWMAVEQLAGSQIISMGPIFQRKRSIK